MNKKLQIEISDYIHKKYGVFILDLIAHVDNTTYFYAELENDKYIYKLISGDFTYFGFPDKFILEMNTLGSILNQKEAIIGEVYGRELLKKDIELRLHDFLNQKTNDFNILVPMDKESITNPNRKMWVNIEVSRINSEDNRSFLFGKMWDATNLGVEYDLNLKYAFMDRLTNFYNRTALDIHTENEHLNDDVFILVNIDNFKEFNEKFGYKFGDKVLKTFSDEIMRTPTDNTGISYYRISGDEFLIRYKNPSIDFINENLLKLKRKMNCVDIDDININLNFSFGVLDMRENKEKSLDYALKKVDENMRKHKNSRAYFTVKK